MNKKLIIINLTLFLTLFCSTLYAKDLTREEYINKYHKIAIKNMKSYGIPASITLAQACLESGNGNSRLASRGNNHFGIKCGSSWKGATIRRNDDARRECFRRYRTAELSFKDHAEFLTSNSRYNSLFSLEQTNYKAWAHGLKAAGYATNPQYAYMLIEIIEKNKLYIYDSYKKSKKREKSNKREMATVTATSAVAETAVVTAASAEGSSKVKVSNNETPLKHSPFYRISSNRELYEINGTTYLRASNVDTYSSLAKEYNLFTKEILSFNDLQKESSIKEGTVVFLEKKKRKSKTASYSVKSGDTLYKISQQFGVQLKSIFKNNQLNSSSVISVGQEVVLK